MCRLYTLSLLHLSYFGIILDHSFTLSVIYGCLLLLDSSSLMRNYFPKRPSGAPLHSLSKLYDVSVGFVTPPPNLRLFIALFAVAEGWLLLDIG